MTAPAPWTSRRVPLWEPYYGAPFGEAIARYWKKYARFDGRASRSEYWWWALADALVIVVLVVAVLLGGLVGSTIDSEGSFSPGPGIAVGVILLVAWWFATLIPGLALGARRLHDVDLSGLLLLLLLIPNLGGLAIFVMTLLPPNPRGARFDIGRRPPSPYANPAGGQQSPPPPA